ncbi:MAG: NUDIX domain-containing protein [Alphaproteobacteria bacterium]|nr:NUDIX domain-containing protein [Alphaproteobacteria bacterium]
MSERSAGILLYRGAPTALEVFLVHPGGPFWANKDEGAWSIPKGLVEDDENLEAAARREFEEETGVKISARLSELGSFRQPSRKIVIAFAAEGDLDAAAIRSNEFVMEWPPKSGRLRRFPEVDRAGWFTPDVAMAKILKGQRPIVEVLTQRLGTKAAKGRSS